MYIYHIREIVEQREANMYSVVLLANPAPNKVEPQNSNSWCCKVFKYDDLSPPTREHVPWFFRLDCLGGRDGDSWPWMTSSHFQCSWSVNEYAHRLPWQPDSYTCIYVIAWGVRRCYWAALFPNLVVPCRTMNSELHSYMYIDKKPWKGFSHNRRAWCQAQPDRVCRMFMCIAHRLCTVCVAKSPVHLV